MVPKFPVYQPNLSGNEKKYVIECLDSSWISGKGRFINEFEEQFSKFIGSKHATSVCNGTVALHLALEALGIGPGDEVIVPTLTYVASVNAITYTGAKPIFVDSLEETWQMDPSDISRKISSNTKAIVCVHLYGHPCEMKEITGIAKKHNLFLIEDCAEAIGTLYDNVHVGTFGDVSTFSFYGNKTITTGEGGMVVTNNETLFERLVHLKGQGLAKYREYWHDAIGFNYRMTNICAAIGLAQLEQVDNFINKKRQIANWYREGFRETGIILQTEAESVKNSYWMCTILLPEDVERIALKEFLIKKGIETRPMFFPVHTMPIYSQKFEKHQIAENLARRGMNLPSYPALEEDEVFLIINFIKMFILKNSKKVN